MVSVRGGMCVNQLWPNALQDCSILALLVSGGSDLSSLSGLLNLGARVCDCECVCELECVRVTQVWPRARKGWRVLGAMMPNYNLENGGYILGMHSGRTKARRVLEL